MGVATYRVRPNTSLIYGPAVMFADLVQAIKDAAGEIDNEKHQTKLRIDKLSSENVKYKELYEQSLARELSLIHEIDELKAEIKSLKRGAVTLISEH